MKLQDLIEDLHANGFDKSYITEDDSIRVRCSQCDALVIQGVPCHETGCRNAVKECEDEDEEYFDDETDF